VRSRVCPRMPVRRGTALWLCLPAALITSGIAGAKAASQVGVIVEAVTENRSGARAGIKPDDVLLSWRREASPPANPTEARGEIRCWSDLIELEYEQAPRGKLWLHGLRKGVSFDVVVPPGTWSLKARPASLPRELERLYAEGSDRVKNGEREQGMALWRQAAQRAEKERHWELAAWLLFRIADACGLDGNWAGAAAAYKACAALAAQHGRFLLAASAWGFRGAALQEQNALVEATESHERALTLREKYGPEGLGVAVSLVSLGNTWMDRGDLQKAEESYTRSLEIIERLAPESVLAFSVLKNLGGVAEQRGDTDRQGAYLVRAWELSKRLDLGQVERARMLCSLGLIARARGNLVSAKDLLTAALATGGMPAVASDVAGDALNGLGLVAREQGDLAEAEKTLKLRLRLEERLHPGSRRVAGALLNSGNVAMERGDVEAAESYYRDSLRIEEQLAPGGLGVAGCLTNLGAVAKERQQLALAEEYSRRALALKERDAPNSSSVAISLANLGELAQSRHDYAEADRLLTAALEIKERRSPGSVTVARTLVTMAGLARERQDPATAERHLLRALPIAERLAPGSALMATCLFMLGEIRRSSGQRDEAERLLRRAVDALDTQRGRAAISEEARATYAAQHADIYRAYVEVLVESNRVAEAFHALERSRARAFLTHLAERDIVFEREIPAELERERRATDAAYERTQTVLANADANDQARIDALLSQLRDLRAKQAEVAERLRKASPRLAALKYPEAVDAARARQALDRGTVLLSYSVGPHKTLLFVISASPQRQVVPAVYTLPVERDALRNEVKSLRQLIEQPGVKDSAFRAAAQRLFDLLIAPARRQIAAGARVVICPDDQLHRLPFAALYDRKEGFLVRWRPIHLADSATAYGELLRSRRKAVASERSFLGFGDPSYRDDATTARLHLTPLPGARRELQEISALLGDKAIAYVGEDATEERVKAVDHDVRYLHFGCHGLVDDHLPLNSALALAMPAEAAEGRENGLLQAWEIIEQVRIRADMVTLSACETGAGQDVAGEGIVGLTRAFHFAGAQSVLASLWSVPDKATTRLMTRLYGYLKAGYSKDAALRAAQLDLIDGRPARNQGAAWRQPLSWAAFQLVGDWR
jgi:CHAT domain-containing protein/tetratricopeptide (TPR) repeat protein